MEKMRSIRPDEIEIRAKGLTKDGKKRTWLLYKTARVDSAILTETYGAFGWQNKFERIGNTLFCSIGVKNPENGEWVWKTDAGDETQVEAVKGEASDAFKRAGFKWGIGVQLYNSPRICLDVAYNYLDIEEIELDENKVTKLVLKSGKDIVFNWSCDKGNSAKTKPVEKPVEEEKPIFVDPKYQRLLADANALGVDLESVKAHCEKMGIALESNGDIPAPILEKAIAKRKSTIAVRDAKEKFEATEVKNG